MTVPDTGSLRRAAQEARIRLRVAWHVLRGRPAMANITTDAGAPIVIRDDNVVLVARNRFPARASS